MLVKMIVSALQDKKVEIATQLNKKINLQQTDVTPPSFYLITNQLNIKL